MELGSSRIFTWCGVYEKGGKIQKAQYGWICNVEEPRALPVPFSQNPEKLDKKLLERTCREIKGSLLGLNHQQPAEHSPHSLYTGRWPFDRTCKPCVNQLES